MKIKLELIDLNGQNRNGVFDSQEAADKWLVDHVDEFGPSPVVTKTDLTAQDEEQKALLSSADIRKGCWDVIDMIRAANRAGGATDAQMDAMYTDPTLVPIMLMLMAGDPERASEKIAVIGPQIYPQAFVDKILAALKALQ